MQEQPKAPGRDGLDEALRELYRVPVPASFQKNWQNAVIREEKQMMKPEKKRKNLWLTRVLPMAAALVLVLGAAWVGAQSPETAGSIISDSGSYGAASRSAKSTGDSANALYMAMPNTATEASYDMAEDAAMAGSGAEQAVTPQAADSRKLVRTADLTIRTDDYDGDLAAVKALVVKVNGYTESEYADGEASNGSTRTANLTVRVPSAKLDEFLTGLTGIGRIASRSESVEDKTVQYADNQARLKTLREKMDRLNALLGKAENVADIIEIETAIADTQYAIDRFETTQRTIDRDVDMSQVYVSLREDSPVAVTSEMSLGERISAAFAASVKGMGQFLRNLLVFLVMALPALAVIAAVIVVIVLIRKSARKKKERQKGPDSQPERPEEES